MLSSNINTQGPYGQERQESDLLQRYKTAFFSNFKAPFGIQRRGQYPDWIYENDPNQTLTDAKIQAHLDGRYSIGTVGRTHTKWVAIDLDVHQGENDLESRFEKVTSCYPEATPLTFSTPGRGLHLYYLLEKSVWTEKATAFAQEALKKGGVELQPGKVELYPTGRLLRSPMAPNCYLLDNSSLEPVAPTRTGCLNILNELLKNRKYDPLIVPEQYIPIPSQWAGARERRGATANLFMQEVEELLAEGLTGPGQRNDALQKLCWHCRVIQELNPEQTEDQMWTWIQTYHNDHSRDFNRSPSEVRKHITRIVRNFDPHKAGVGTERVAAPKEDIDAPIARYLENQPLEANEKDLLGHMLSRGHRKGKAIHESWLEVEIPAQTLRSWCRTYLPLLRALMDKGYIQKGQEYGTHIRRCRSYKVPRLGGAKSECTTL